MNNDSETRHLLARCRLQETVVQQSIQIDELERELLRCYIKRVLKRQDKRRRRNLRCLAELDQIAAELRRHQSITEETNER
jgi:hypothetical protein